MFFRLRTPRYYDATNSLMYHPFLPCNFGRSKFHSIGDSRPWCALYRFFDSSVGYPYGSVYFFLSHFFFFSINSLFLPLCAFFSIYFCFKLLYEYRSFLSLNCHKGQVRCFETSFILPAQATVQAPLRLIPFLSFNRLNSNNSYLMRGNIFSLK